MVMFTTGWWTFLEVTLIVLNSMGLPQLLYLSLLVSFKAQLLGRPPLLLMQPISNQSQQVTAKYADDTYLIVPAVNVGSRTLELDNIDEWAKANSLTLNRSKSAEIVIILIGRGSAMTPSHHGCQTYTEYLLSRFSVLPSRTNCLLTIMSAILSASVHRLYTH